MTHGLHGRLAAVLLFAVLPACALIAPASPSPAAGTLAEELEAVFSDSTLDHAHWGVVVRSLATGETLYQRNAERNFVPASNVKLLTGAAVLETLGPDYRYRTVLAAGGPVANGVLRGSLVVFGSGDPTLSERFTDDPRATFREWADSLRVRGITRIAGGVVGVDSAFAGPTLGSGWMWDDLDSPDAAEFDALQFSESAIEIQVVPSGTVGQPAVVMLEPQTQYVRLFNQTVTAPAGSPTRLRVTREPLGPGITVEGEVAADTSLLRRSVAVRDPTLYFLSVLRETLREAGVLVEGPPTDADFLPAEDFSVTRAVPLFEHLSPPLREILPAMLGPSQNQIAESLLRTLGWELRGEGSARAGAAVADSLFRLWGMETRNLRFADGSGMSRYNLASPALFAGVLTHMTHSPNWEVWSASLPEAGRTGTLARRMREPPLHANVRAKTGTMTGIRALSGYLTTARGERVVFSTIVNNHARSAAAVDRVVDAALQRVVEAR